MELVSSELGGPTQSIWFRRAPSCVVADNLSFQILSKQESLLRLDMPVPGIWIAPHDLINQSAHFNEQNPAQDFNPPKMRENYLQQLSKGGVITVEFLNIGGQYSNKYMGEIPGGLVPFKF